MALLIKNKIFDFFTKTIRRKDVSNTKKINKKMDAFTNFLQAVCQDLLKGYFNLHCRTLPGVKVSLMNSCSATVTLFKIKEDSSGHSVYSFKADSG